MRIDESATACTRLDGMERITGQGKQCPRRLPSASITGVSESTRTYTRFSTMLILSPKQILPVSLAILGEFGFGRLAQALEVAGGIRATPNLFSLNRWLLSGDLSLASTNYSQKLAAPRVLLPAHTHLLHFCAFEKRPTPLLLR